MNKCDREYHQQFVVVPIIVSTVEVGPFLGLWGRTGTLLGTQNLGNGAVFLLRFAENSGASEGG